MSVWGAGCDDAASTFLHMDPESASRPRAGPERVCLPCMVRPVLLPPPCSLRVRWFLGIICTVADWTRGRFQLPIFASPHSPCCVSSMYLVDTNVAVTFRPHPPVPVSRKLSVK